MNVLPKCLASFLFRPLLACNKDGEGWGEATTLQQHKAKVQTSREAGHRVTTEKGA